MVRPGHCPGGNGSLHFFCAAGCALQKAGTWADIREQDCYYTMLPGAPPGERREAGLAKREVVLGCGLLEGLYFHWQITEYTRI